MAGLSNCGVSIPDVWSISHNQAGLAFISTTSIAIDHQQRFMLKETGLNNIAFILPAHKSSFGLHVTYFGFSKYHENKFGLAYAIKLCQNIAVGVQLDYFNSFIISSENPVKQITFETGIMAQPLENLFIGLHVFNPLPEKWNQYKESAIPLIARFGASYLIENTLLFALESQFNSTEKTIFKLGAEYSPLKKIALRMGISSGENQYSFGLGYSWKKFRSGFSYIRHQILGTTPSIDIIYAW